MKLQNRSIGERIFNAFNYLFLSLLALVFFLPLWHVFMYSISDIYHSNVTGLFLWPRGLDLGVYQTLLVPGSLVLSGLRVSAIVTIVGTALGTLISAMLAYPISKPHLKGRRLVMFLVIFTMIFSGGFIQDYLLIRNMGLYDSLWALILPLMLDGFNIIIFRNYFQGIPLEIEESAKIDGAGHFCVFFRIILPISTAVLATVALFICIRYWNDYFSSVLYISSNDKWSLAQVLRDMIQASIASNANTMINKARTNIAQLRNVTIMITVLPMLLVYPLVQRYFVKGVVLGAVKG